MIRIAFVTGHLFGVRALEGIISSNAYRRGSAALPIVVGLGAERATKTVGYASPESIARAIGATIVMTTDGSLRTVSPMLESADIDYLLVIGWSRIIPSQVLGIAKCAIAGKPGAIGMHPTLLPTGRGRAPISWTIINGLRSTGLTTFRLDERADAGDILMSTEISVASDETSTSLFFRIADLHFHAGHDLANELADGRLNPRAQDETRASEWQKRSPKDSEILSSMSFELAERVIRAQSFPYPGAFALINGGSRNVNAIRRDLNEAEIVTDSGEWMKYQLADGDAWVHCITSVPAKGT